MLRFVRRLGLFLLPFVGLVVVESLLPVDFFTFRCWEALRETGFVYLPGEFYPNQHILKYEAGDHLGFRDPVRLKVDWYTDEYGFRNRPCVNPPDRYDYVLLGDSNIVGCSLDQSDTLAEVLARKGNCTVYSYGGAPKRRFWSDPRFRDYPPRTIVVEARPGEFYKALMRDCNSVEPCEMPHSCLPMQVQVVMDRIYKQSMLQFIKSRLGSARTADPFAATSSDLSLDDRVTFTVNSVLAMQAKAHEWGSDFIFFLMPWVDRTLDAAVVQLRQAGVKTIAYLPTDQYPNGVDIDWYYHLYRDTHWTKEAVVMTADEILKLRTK